jgi:hypothetical protein
MIDQFTGRHFFLSPFYRHSIPGAHGIVYPSAEAAFHGGKTDDPRLRAWLAEAPAPQVAQRRARDIPLPTDWDTHRHVVMRAVLTAKFADPALAHQLLATGDTALINGNYWHDQFWGSCRCGRACCAEPGRNWLGRHLTAIRAELAAADNTQADLAA